jgi:hypothetical protein
MGILYKKSAVISTPVVPLRVPRLRRVPSHHPITPLTQYPINPSFQYSTIPPFHYSIIPSKIPDYWNLPWFMVSYLRGKNEY